MIINGSRQLALVVLGITGLVFISTAADKPGDGQGQQQSPFNARVGLRDWPQLGGSPRRNNTPVGENIPTEWDIATGRNVKWRATLGSQTYGNVVVANGRVYVGTNNAAGYLDRYPNEIDLGVLLCFREADGEFLWQHSSEKLATGRAHDWPQQGICSAPVVEGDRLWFVTNRGEVVCLDTDGFYDGEDDGRETGVWQSVFDVSFDLSQWPEEPQEPYSSKFEVTLRSLVKGLDPDLRDWYAFKWTAESNGRSATTRSSPTTDRTLFQVQLTPEAVVITGLNTYDNPVSIHPDLLAGLNEGILSPGLRLIFASRGIELGEKAAPTVVRIGTHWLIRTELAGIPTTFRLEKQTSELVCERQISSAGRCEADVIWSFNMMHALGVRQHNMATCAPTIWGDVLFLCTSNGVDETHHRIPAPDAPSFIAMDKHTGEILWTDNSPGTNIMHGQWSCPAVGVFEGVPQVLFAGGDGWLYSFRADRWNDGKPELLWKFDGNPKDSVYLLGGRATRNGIIAVPVICDGLVYLGMGEDPEHGEGNGHLWCIDPTRRGDVSPELVLDQRGQIVPPRRLAAFSPWEDLFNVTTAADTWEQFDQRELPESVRLEFQKVGVVLPGDVNVTPLTKLTNWQLDAEIAGEPRQFRLERRNWSYNTSSGRNLWAGQRTTAKIVPNPNSAAVWHYDKYDQTSDGTIAFEETMHRTLGSPTIKNNLLFLSDMSGLVHCLNARTGEPYWTCDLFASCWTTPLIVGENVYVVDEDGDVAIFSLSTDPTKSVRSITAGAGPESNEPLREFNMGTSIYTMPVVANNVLYIAAKNELFALAAGEETPRHIRPQAGKPR